VTGRVVELQAEADGDLHVALQDATGDKPGIVVAEIPAKPHKRWCELRKIVFSWAHAKFPFRVRSGRKLKITEPRTITATGKAFFDINHAPADQSNRRLRGFRRYSRIAVSSSTNAVSFSSARTTKRFPSSRCASATKMVRLLESTVETQPPSSCRCPVLFRFEDVLLK